MRKLFTILLILTLFSYPAWAGEQYLLQKPITGALVNISHPYAKGLTAWFLNEGSGKAFSQGTESIAVTPGSTFLWTSGGLEGDGAGTAVALLPARHWTPPSYTIIVDFEWHAIQDAVLGGAAYDDGGYGFFMNDANTLYSNADGSYKFVTVTGAFPTAGHKVLAFTKDGTLGTWYINGVKVGSDNTFLVGSALGIDSLSGYAAGASTIDGILHYVLIYDHVKTPAEIAFLYNQPFAVLQNPIADLMREGFGGTAAPTGAPQIIGPVMGKKRILPEDFFRSYVAADDYYFRQVVND